MARACIAAIHEATGKVFSDEEADDVVNRLTQKAIKARKAAPSLSDREAVAQAAGELTREQLLQALTERRLKLANQVATAGREKALAAYPATMLPRDKLNALNVGSERQGRGTSASVDARARARQMMFWGKVEIGLEKMPGLVQRMANPFLGAERGFDRLVAREMARLDRRRRY